MQDPTHQIKTPPLPDPLDISHLPEVEGIQEPTPIPEGDDDLCRSLWLAVIVQAVNDANSNRSRPCYKKDKDCALQWIMGTGPDQGQDFKKVCGLAEVDPIKLRKIIDKALAGEHDGFNFRCLMKHATCSRRDEPESRKSYFKRLRRSDAKKLRRARDLSFEALEKQEFESVH